MGWRKFTCSEHQLIGNWQKRDNKWTCPWCIARETPDGEQKHREYLKSRMPVTRDKRSQRAKGPTPDEVHYVLP